LPTKKGNLKELEFITLLNLNDHVGTKRGGKREAYNNIRNP